MNAMPTVRFTLSWLAAFAVLSAAIPAVFSSGLRWDRVWFLVPYIGGTGLLLAVFFRRAGMAWSDFWNGWTYGLLAAAAACLFLIRNVLGQPASAVPEGGLLVVNLLWVGLAYGATDGLLLNVMPVVAVQGAGFYRAPASWRTRLVKGGLALAASLFITAAYHLGYTEFRGLAVLSALLGNAIVTATYLLTGSPLAAVLTHVVMHGAALLHGMETTLQLPPHY